MLQPRPRFHLISATGGIITNEERAAQAAETMGFRRVSRSEYNKHMRRVNAHENRRREQEQAHERAIKHQKS